MPAVQLNDFLTPVVLTLKVSFVASFIVFVLAFFSAWWMQYRDFFGKTLLETICMLPMVLSPSVVGFLLLMLLGKRGWIGRFIAWLSGQTVLFTWWAAVIAAVVVSFPLAYQTIKTGLSWIGRDLVAAARSFGANEWQLLWYVTIPLARRSLLTAYMLGFVRSLGEFGATLMIAGNIPGKTQTVATAIYLAIDSENMTLAWLWVATMVILSFLILLIVRLRKQTDEV